MNTEAKRFLIVDDDQNTRKHIAKWLKLHGFEVVEAISSDEAIVHFGSGRFDCVLFDLKQDEARRRETILNLRLLQPGCEIIVVPNVDKFLPVATSVVAGRPRYS